MSRANKQHDDESGHRTVRRRTMLKTTAGVTLASITGCLGQDGGGGGGGDGGDGGDGGNGGDESDSGDGEMTGGGSKDPIIAGIPQPISGQYDWYGPLQWDVVQALTDIVNTEHDGINGREVKPILEDTDTTAEGAVSATRKLISEDNVHWISGYTSATIMSIVDIVKENKVPTMAAVASTSNLDCVGGDWIYRAFPSDSQIGAAFAPAIAKKEHNATKDFRKAAAFVSQQADKRTYYNALNFEPSEADLVKFIEFPPDKSSFKSEGSALANTDAEIAIMLAGAPQSVSLLTAAFNAGYEGTWIGQEDQGDEQFLDDMLDPQLANGGLVILPAAKEPSIERRDQLRSQLEDIMGEQPGVDWMNTTDGYLTMLVATKAALVREGEVSRQAVNNQVRKIALPPGQEVTSYGEAAELIDAGEEINWQGLVSNLDFDELGNVTAPMAVHKAVEESGELNYKQTGYISIEELNEYYEPPGC